MKTFVIGLLFLPMFVSAGQAQDSTRLERYGYVVGSSLAFALVDYVGFNELKKMNGGVHYEASPLYRIAEGIIQAAITYFLYKQCGLSSAISFNLIWWTWGDDFAYYGWGYLTGLYPWESSRESGLRFHEYNSAGWTPIGLTRQQGSWIAKSTLLAQSVVGFSISMAILW